MQVTVSQISQSSIFLSRASTADFPEVSSDWRLAQLHLYKDCSLPSETGGREKKKKEKDTYMLAHSSQILIYKRQKKSKVPTSWLLSGQLQEIFHLLNDPVS